MNALNEELSAAVKKKVVIAGTTPGVGGKEEGVGTVRNVDLVERNKQFPAAAVDPKETSPSQQRVLRTTTNGKSIEKDVGATIHNDVVDKKVEKQLPPHTYYFVYTNKR